MSVNPYTVILIDWPVHGTYRIKSFSDFKSANKMIRSFVSQHETMADRFIVVKGEVIQIGEQQHNR